MGEDKNQVSIEFTGFIEGLGTCMDIRFMHLRNEYKTFMPLKAIKRIMPHNDPGWSRIYWGEHEAFAIPMEYDELVELIKKKSMDISTEEENG